MGLGSRGVVPGHLHGPRGGLPPPHPWDLTPHRRPLCLLLPACRPKALAPCARSLDTEVLHPLLEGSVPLAPRHLCAVPGACAAFVSCPTCGHLHLLPRVTSLLRTRDDPPRHHHTCSSRLVCLSPHERQLPERHPHTARTVLARPTARSGIRKQRGSSDPAAADSLNQKACGRAAPADTADTQETDHYSESRPRQPVGGGPSHGMPDVVTEPLAPPIWGLELSREPCPASLGRQKAMTFEGQTR